MMKVHVNSCSLNHLPTEIERINEAGGNFIQVIETYLIDNKGFKLLESQVIPGRLVDLKDGTEKSSCISYTKMVIYLCEMPEILEVEEPLVDLIISENEISELSSLLEGIDSIIVHCMGNTSYVCHNCREEISMDEGGPKDIKHKENCLAIKWQRRFKITSMDLDIRECFEDPDD